MSIINTTYNAVRARWEAYCEEACYSMDLNLDYDYDCECMDSYANVATCLHFRISETFLEECLWLS